MELKEISYYTKTEKVRYKVNYNQYKERDKIVLFVNGIKRKNSSSLRYFKCCFCDKEFREREIFWNCTGLKKTGFGSGKKYLHKDCLLSFDPATRREWLELSFSIALEIPFDSNIGKVYKIIYDDEKNKNEVVPNKYKHYEFFYEEDISDTELDESIFGKQPIATKTDDVILKSGIKRPKLKEESEEKIIKRWQDTERKCLVCTESFLPKMFIQKYCSRECANKWHNDKWYIKLHGERKKRMEKKRIEKMEKRIEKREKRMEKRAKKIIDDLTKYKKYLQKDFKKGNDLITKIDKIVEDLKKKQNN